MAARKIKRERALSDVSRRRVARPGPSDTQMEIDEDGGFQEISTADLPATEKEVIMIDD